MRYMWLAVAVLAGCSPTPTRVVTDITQAAQTVYEGWVIGGTTPQTLLLTNGKFGLWIATDQGPAKHDAFRMIDGALVPILDFEATHQIPLLERETHEWSFDLRTGEFVGRKMRGGRAKEIRVVMHPTRPIAAVRLQMTGAVEQGKRPPADEPAGLGVAGAKANLPLLSSSRKDGIETRVVRAYPAIEGELEEPLQVTIANRGGQHVFGVFADGEDQILPQNYDEVLAASEESHDEFWKADIEIDGPAEDQLAIRTMLYYVRRGATDKLPPFGTTNAKYRGARFWDAEAWMLPVLAFVDREKAVEATEWRIKNTRGRMPWEAANGARDVTPKEFGNALHVTGWVAWWFQRAGELGLVHPKGQTGALMTAMRQYLKSIEHTDRGYEIRGVESPDEGKLRDNDLVTNVLSRLVGKWSLESAITKRDDMLPLTKVLLPKESDGLPATYDNDAMKGYQQTAALLTVFPLEFFEGEIAEKMFDRYADLTSEVGPAMSESVHATIAARLKRADAYDRWRRSWQIYTDDAMMFHEKRVKTKDGKDIYPVEVPSGGLVEYAGRRHYPDDAYFMTGAAGCLQTVLFGFSGIRFEPIEWEVDAVVVYPLRGQLITFRPNLPDQWRSIKLKNIWLGEKRTTILIDAKGATPVEE